MFDARLPLLAATALAISASVAPVADASKKARQAQTENCAAADARPGEASVSEIRAATLCLLNTERRNEGRPSLRLNFKLGTVATRYSGQMVDDGFFGHVSPGGSTLTSRVRKTSYIGGARSWSLGENLAWGTGKLATPRTTVKNWMNSPGHRANIMNGKFKDIGIGIVTGTPSGSAEGATYTTDFGRRN